MLSRRDYRRFLSEANHQRRKNEWAVFGIIALTFGPVLLADLFGRLIH